MLKDLRPTVNLCHPLDETLFCLIFSVRQQDTWSVCVHGICASATTKCVHRQVMCKTHCASAAGVCVDKQVMLYKHRASTAKECLDRHFMFKIHWASAATECVVRRVVFLRDLRVKCSTWTCCSCNPWHERLELEPAVLHVQGVFSLSASPSPGPCWTLHAWLFKKMVWLVVPQDRPTQLAVVQMDSAPVKKHTFELSCNNELSGAWRGY